MSETTVVEAMEIIRNSYSEGQLRKMDELQDEAKRRLKTRGVSLRPQGNFLFGSVDYTLNQQGEVQIFECTGANTRGISCLPDYERVVAVSLARSLEIFDPKGAVITYDAGHRFPDEQDAFVSAVRKIYQGTTSISKEELARRVELRGEKLYVDGKIVSLIVGDYLLDEDRFNELRTRCINSKRTHNLMRSKGQTANAIEAYRKKVGFPVRLTTEHFANHCLTFGEIDNAVNEGLEKSRYIVIKPEGSTYAKGVRVVKDTKDLRSVLEEAQDEYEKEFKRSPPSWCVSAYADNITRKGHPIDSRLFVGQEDSGEYKILGGVVRVARSRKFEGETNGWFNVNLTVTNPNTGKKRVENERMLPFSIDILANLDLMLNEEKVISAMEGILLATIALDQKQE